MTKQAVLFTELETSQALLDIIVNKRKKKMFIRWFLGIVFYASFWDANWVRNLLWIAIPLELLLLAFTLYSYYRLKNKIKNIEGQLERGEM